MLYKRCIKRIVDIVISGVSIIILAPLFIVVGIIIKIDSKGEIIFKHKRFGKDCKPIYVWKFRTMVKNAQDIGPNYTSSYDSRITKFGKILRKTSLDELPQIVNVLKGEMSLIGPRPDAFVENPNEFQKKRTVVLPGITGLSQVNGRSNLSIEEKEFYDLEYTKNISFKTDISIVIKTIKVVFLKEGTN